MAIPTAFQAQRPSGPTLATDEAEGVIFTRSSIYHFKPCEASTYSVVLVPRNELSDSARIVLLLWRSSKMASKFITMTGWTWILLASLPQAVNAPLHAQGQAE